MFDSEKIKSVLEIRRSNARKHESRKAEERRLQEESSQKLDSQLKECNADIDYQMKQNLTFSEEQRSKHRELQEANLETMGKVQMEHLNRIAQVSEYQLKEIERRVAIEKTNSQNLHNNQMLEKQQMLNDLNAEQHRAEEEIRVWKENFENQSENNQKRDTERIKLIGELDKEHKGEIEAIQKEISARHAEQERHSTIVHHIQVVGLAARAGFDRTEAQMDTNRRANFDISGITKQLNTLKSTVSEILSPIQVAHNLDSPDLLKRQYMLLSRKGEEVLTKKLRIEGMMDQFQRTSIDENDSSRNNIIGEVRRELLKLNDLHSTITMLEPKKSQEVDTKFVKSLLDAASHGMTAIELAMTLWNNLPKADGSDLVYKQFVQVNEVLMDNAQLSGVNKLDLSF